MSVFWAFVTLMVNVAPELRVRCPAPFTISDWPERVAERSPVNVGLRPLIAHDAPANSSSKNGGGPTPSGSNFTDIDEVPFPTSVPISSFVTTVPAAWPGECTVQLAGVVTATSVYVTLHLESVHESTAGFSPVLLFVSEQSESTFLASSLVAIPPTVASRTAGVDAVVSLAVFSLVPVTSVVSVIATCLNAPSPVFVVSQWASAKSP